jgi:hypothetical protein
MHHIWHIETKSSYFDYQSQCGFVTNLYPYSTDIHVAEDVFVREIQRWGTRWGMMGEKPSTLAKTLFVTNKELYSYIYMQSSRSLSPCHHLQQQLKDRSMP